jgi:hypothetical protein
MDREEDCTGRGDREHGKGQEVGEEKQRGEDEEWVNRLGYLNKLRIAI